MACYACGKSVDELVDAQNSHCLSPCYGIYPAYNLDIYF